MDIESYLTKRMASLDGETSLVRDFRVFDFAWVPDKPLVRDEARPIIDALLTYGRTGIPQNLVVLGSRGCGKPLPHALPAAVAQGEGRTGDPLRQLSHGQLELQDPGGVPRGRSTRGASLPGAVRPLRGRVPGRRRPSSCSTRSI